MRGRSPGGGGATRLDGASRGRLPDLQQVVDQLSDVYTDEGIKTWLHAPQRGLDGRSPLDLLDDGQLEAVLSAVERLAGGPRR